MKTLAISRLPVSVTSYTETGLSAPQKPSPKQRISRITADTKANQSSYATTRYLGFERHSMQPAGLCLSRHAMHSFAMIVHAAVRQPPTERISQARPALNPV